MRTRVIFLNIVLVVLVLCWALNSMGESSCRDIPGVLLVKFKPGLLTDHNTKRSGKLTTGIISFDLLNTKYNVSDIRKVFPEETAVPPANSNLLDLSGFYEIEFPEESNLQALISIYSQDPNLEIVETVKMCPVDAVPNDPETQWHLNNLLGNDADVDAYEAWDLETGDSSIILAILDTGVGYYCPELSWNIWTNPGEIKDNGVDDDLNGKVDDYYGWDFVTGGSLCDVEGGEDCGGADNNPSDFDGHGTNVSGIAAAVTNNNAGVAGLAGGWYPAKKGCKIMVLRVGWHATDGLGYVNMNFAAQAMDYARLKGAKAINCSFGSSYTSALASAVINALNQGIVICKSAGNDNQVVDDYLINSFSEVLGIAALNRYDQKASFSNFGIDVDISAPGDDIRSVGGENYNCGISVYSGTSQAAPMVTGLVGLLRSRVPDLTIAQITSLIQDNADSIDYLNPGYEGQLGAGRISLYRSLLPLPHAKFSTSATLGNIPLDVQFTDSSYGDGLYYWKWDFGDGDTIGLTTPVDTSHTYAEPGIYTCSYSASGAWGTNTKKILIGATADTVNVSSTQGLAGEYGVKVPLYANNNIPVSEMIIAMRYGDGTAPLTCDSVRFWGTRVESFPIKNVSVHKTNQTILLTLRNTNDPLEPGSGLLANMYFKLDALASIGDTLQVDTAIIGSSYMKYNSILGEYVPDFQIGGIYVVEPIWGDANRDGSVTVSDVIFLINYLFKGGATSNPKYIGDANCDGDVTVSDVVYIITHLFKGGPKPDC